MTVAARPNGEEEICAKLALILANAVAELYALERSLPAPVRIENAVVLSKVPGMVQVLKHFGMEIDRCRSKYN